MRETFVEFDMGVAFAGEAVARVILDVCETLVGCGRVELVDIQMNVYWCNKVESYNKVNRVETY